jgi:hypothetical protein
MTRKDPKSLIPFKKVAFVINRKTMEAVEQGA